jgi:hypothetical protein
MLENLEGTPAEDLQFILGNLNPNAEAEEQRFILQLQSMRGSLESTDDTELAGLQDRVAKEKEAAPIRGLLSEARKRGLTTSAFADAVRLSTSLVMKFDLRLIRYTSIPRQVIEDIASTIKISADQVALYLQGDPIRTAVVYSETDVSEESQGQQDFLDVAREDNSLSEERRGRLLSMVSR